MIIYDYIIVGSGPAGLTFATLADKNDKIKLLVVVIKLIDKNMKMNIIFLNMDQDFILIIMLILKQYYLLLVLNFQIYLLNII